MTQWEKLWVKAATFLTGSPLWLEEEDPPTPPNYFYLDLPRVGMEPWLEEEDTNPSDPVELLFPWPATCRVGALVGGGGHITLRPRRTLNKEKNYYYAIFIISDEQSVAAYYKILNKNNWQNIVLFCLLPLSNSSIKKDNIG